MKPRYAAVDMGTNSVRLLVAEVKEGRVVPLLTRLVTTRLGRELEQRKKLHPESRQATLAAVIDYARLCQEMGVMKAYGVATSAVREAEDGKEFVAEVTAKSGIPFAVISGKEEAYLTYSGVAGSFSTQNPGPLVVVDIGGGSTELVWQEEGEVQAESVPVGAVKVTEKGTGQEEIRKMLQPVTKRVLAALRSDFTLVGVGGTATTFAAVDLELTEYSREKVQGYVLSRERVAQILHCLEGMSLAERQKVPGLMPQRADIICAGGTILLTVMEELRRERITVSEADLLEGVIYRLLKEKESSFCRNI
ncbi:MAG: exopolyphosphatase / guanosine-5-triphosphate,3-diphosphate pyrophosphatase [Eubacteriales bacterium]|nr:exopolyphosphatase / guanosine-5-triphosphate,3-diphosphate pyrophosphatase [Eubacteriales bacterium]MDN5362958.1 exopolyphosphatase / guanosine-5-triphosphate,3-diphosphate pyrophosphatase [Eubacteriales bacterium]